MGQVGQYSGGGDFVLVWGLNTHCPVSVSHPSPRDACHHLGNFLQAASPSRASSRPPGAALKGVSTSVPPLTLGAHQAGVCVRGKHAFTRPVSSQLLSQGPLRDMSPCTDDHGDGVLPGRIEMAAVDRGTCRRAGPPGQCHSCPVSPKGHHSDPCAEHCSTPATESDLGKWCGRVSCLPASDNPRQLPGWSLPSCASESLNIRVSVTCVCLTESWPYVISSLFPTMSVFL